MESIRYSNPTEQNGGRRLMGFLGFTSHSLWHFLMDNVVAICTEKNTSQKSTFHRANNRLRRSQFQTRPYLSPEVGSTFKLVQHVPHEALEPTPASLHAFCDRAFQRETAALHGRRQDRPVSFLFAGGGRSSLCHPTHHPF